MGFQHGSIRKSAEGIDVSYLGEVDYTETWHTQAELATKRANGEIPDTLLILQHPSTYTAGKRTEPSDRPTNGLPVVDVDRGGRITWHGPGQLVAYPLIQLADPVDVVDFVRRMEQALIQTCLDVGLTGVGRVEGRSGVWLPSGVVGGELKPARKIAAIGIRITRGVTMHGVSLNCNNSFAAYESIVPCGIADAGVTSLSLELGRDVGVEEVEKCLETNIINALNGDLTLT
ncbi:lipoyl(octanoyl) transferase LipB [Corynebacterium suicordis]|uniref:Octanoyltransferase n=1 Tax=Corynebacterium suicordis DSM 45110 TaxID=1121369 RepID=A0ABR9ZK85_9CORY|nr:lipoyl(octanoyl) transferase LipB [Corynebacterium suicordis]MBF4553848.1 lipoyl(octanoyl) transferase LipB [Corynebacterium suicordis DSM 45110]MDR6277175.1 lipoyl(octanoyl) transferase [Corynebacterium suicordis]